MAIVEQDLEQTLTEFKVLAGAEPLIDIFKKNSWESSLESIGIPKWKKLVPAIEDLLIAEARLSTHNMVLALRQIGRGLVLVIAQGTLDNISRHHVDILLDPPVSYTRRDDYRDIAVDHCPDCNARLLATVESREHGILGNPEESVAEMYINFFGGVNKAGSEETGFLLNVLQQVQSKSSKVSPFIRNK